MIHCGDCLDILPTLDVGIDGKLFARGYHDIT